MKGEDSESVLREAFRQQQRVPLCETWTQEQWCEAFSFLFKSAPGLRHTLLEHQDDMLWFVTAPEAMRSGIPPVSLRRNTSADLAPDLRPGGAAFPSIAWAPSFQLNLIVQAKQGSLATIAQLYASSGQWGSHGVSLEPAVQANTVVTQRRVFASPMAGDINLEDAKSGGPPRACYPDICFAVDNYEEAFQVVELSHAEDCYCVMLHVHSSGSPGPPAENDRPITSTAPAQNRTKQSQARPVERRAVLFSAYVTREQVATYIATRAAESPKPSLLDRLIRSPRKANGREKVVMMGPGGVGRAEVLASASAPDRAGGSASVPMQLSLMWMSLPAPALAQAILRFACGADT